MEEPFPYFRYHPGAVANGSFILSDERCASCQRVRGYIYRLPVYRVGPHVWLCPWCIAQGVVASKYEGELNDMVGCEEFVQDAAILDEVGCRTPSFHSWQDYAWPTHCNDCAVYLTDVRHEMMTGWFPGCYDTVIRELNAYTQIDMTMELVRGLVVDVYCHLFQCRHCLEYEVIVDCS